MPFTAFGKNSMINYLAKGTTISPVAEPFVGLLETGNGSGTQNTEKGFKQSAPGAEFVGETWTPTAKGLIIITKLEAKGTEGEAFAATGAAGAQNTLKVGQPYFIKAISGEKFELCGLNESQVITTTSALGSSKAIELNEFSETLPKAGYARVKTKWATAGSINGALLWETTTPEIEVEAEVGAGKEPTVNYVGYWLVSKKATETKANEGLFAIFKVTAEKYSAVGKYKIETAELNLDYFT